MIVVTAGSHDYRRIIESQARRCREFGYSHQAYDLGGLNLPGAIPLAVDAADLAPSVNGDSLPPATFKAQLIIDALRERDSFHEWACWLDGDCIPIRPFEPEGFNWDAAVTLRPAPEVGASNNPALDFLNSGVVWFRNTAYGALLAEEWDTASALLQTDQGALNQVVAPLFGSREWIGAVGGIVRAPCGARVLVLDGTFWNCWALPPRPGTRILHFKRGIRGSAVNYL